ncbi:MAG TPA: hypothetical protein VFS43_31835 [Polyangiaceae bacterium]|nr:hypothetical protein [Polyangiaceae bacterium]
MLLFRRTALFGALTSLAAACSAPDTRGIFDAPLPPGSGNDVLVPGCIERCRGAAAKCTLINVPCDALCGAGLSGPQLDCLAARAETCRADGDSLVADCVGSDAAVEGFLGAPCDCGGLTSCDNSTCLDGLLCFDPGGSDTAAGVVLFPGFCSVPCDAPGTGSRTCPQGFVCRRQLFNDVPVAAEEGQHWCQR